MAPPTEPTPSPAEMSHHNGNSFVLHMDPQLCHDGCGMWVWCKSEDTSMLWWVWHVGVVRRTNI